MLCRYCRGDCWIFFWLLVPPYPFLFSNTFFHPPPFFSHFLVLQSTRRTIYSSYSECVQDWNYLQQFILNDFLSLVRIILLMKPGYKAMLFNYLGSSKIRQKSMKHNSIPTIHAVELFLQTLQLMPSLKSKGIPHFEMVFMYFHFSLCLNLNYEMESRSYRVAKCSPWIP